jgi:hypothetical protein
VRRADGFETVACIVDAFEAAEQFRVARQPLRAAHQLDILDDDQGPLQGQSRLAQLLPPGDGADQVGVQPLNPAAEIVQPEEVGRLRQVALGSQQRLIKTGWQKNAGPEHAGNQQQQQHHREDGTRRQSRPEEAH